MGKEAQSCCRGLGWTYFLTYERFTVAERGFISICETHLPEGQTHKDRVSTGQL